MTSTTYLPARSGATVPEHQLFGIGLLFALTVTLLVLGVFALRNRLFRGLGR